MAFKKPRELTWVSGVILAVITVSFGVTGYSLPWDQVGYWAVKIVSGVPEAIPVVGVLISDLLRGGSSVGQATLDSLLQRSHLCATLVDCGLHAVPLLDDPQARYFRSFVISKLLAKRQQLQFPDQVVCFKLRENNTISCRTHTTI